MDNIVSLEQQNFTLIGAECSLKGTFHFKGATHICGSLEGEVHIKDESILTLEPEAKIEGKVFSGDLKLYGTVKGEVYSSGVVEVFPSAKVDGLINSKNLIVHPGAILNFDGHTAGL